MAYDPNIRASDADRDRTASLLREHLAAGRLTPEEFSERLDRAFSARTLGEVDSLLRDLPSIDLYRLPDAQLTRRPRQADGSSDRGSGHSGAWRAAWGIWFAVVIVCFVVAGLTTGGYLWPLLVALPTGAVLAGGWVTANALRSGSAHRSVGGGPSQGRLPSGDEDLPGRPPR
jgi:hypothetical protein